MKRPEDARDVFRKPSSRYKPQIYAVPLRVQLLLGVYPHRSNTRLCISSPTPSAPEDSLLS